MEEEGGEGSVDQKERVRVRFPNDQRNLGLTQTVPPAPIQESRGMSEVYSSLRQHPWHAMDSVVIPDWEIGPTAADFLSPISGPPLRASPLRQLSGELPSF